MTKPLDFGGLGIGNLRPSLSWLNGCGVVLMMNLTPYDIRSLWECMGPSFLVNLGRGSEKQSYNSMERYLHWVPMFISICLVFGW